VRSKENQQIRPEPQLQIHPKHWFLRSSEGMIQWSKIIQNSDHIKSQPNQLHIRHGEALVPPFLTQSMGQRAPDHRLAWKMMNAKTHAVTHTKHPKKRSHQRIMSWSAPCEPLFEGLKDWLQGPWGMPFVNTQANPLPISTHRGMKQNCSDFMIFKILKDIIFQQNGWGRMPWPQFKVGWKANIRVALNTGWRDDPGSHTSGRRKLHGLEAACWVIGDIGEQQAPNGSQLFNLGKSNIVRDSEIFKVKASKKCCSLPPLSTPRGC
jgi:hypothetical protein